MWTNNFSNKRNFQQNKGKFGKIHDAILFCNWLRNAHASKASRVAVLQRVTGCNWVRNVVKCKSLLYVYCNSLRSSLLRSDLQWMCYRSISVACSQRRCVASCKKSGRRRLQQQPLKLHFLFLFALFNRLQLMFMWRVWAASMRDSTIETQRISDGFCFNVFVASKTRKQRL